MTEAIRTDKDLERVREIAKSFISSEEHPLTDELIEIAGTTKNPEVLALCGSCIQDMINNIYRYFSIDHNRGKDTSRKIPIINCLSAIAGNPNIDEKTLNQCMRNITNVFGSTSLAFKSLVEPEDEEYTTSIFNCLVKIVENSKTNYWTLSYSLNPLNPIVSIGQNHPNEEIKKMVIKGLLAMTINGGNILPSDSIKHIRDVANTISEDASKIKIINDIIDENKEPNAISLKYCAMVIGGIAPTLKDEDEKIKFIGNIFEIVKNENSDPDTLASCVIAIREIAATLTDQKGKERAIIDVLSEIIQNKNSNNNVWKLCITFLNDIIKTLEDEETKKLAIKTLLGIYMHKNCHENRFNFPFDNPDSLLNIANLQDKTKEELISFIATQQAEQAVNVEQLGYCRRAIRCIICPETFLEMHHNISIPSAPQKRELFEKYAKEFLERIREKMIVLSHTEEPNNKRSRTETTTETTSENFLSLQRTGSGSTKVNAAIAAAEVGAAAAAAVSPMKRPGDSLYDTELATKKTRTYGRQS